MNSAPVNIRTLLMPLIRPMPMKAPLQDDSATASSERAETCGGREGERDINYVPYSLCSPALAPVPNVLLMSGRSRDEGRSERRGCPRRRYSAHYGRSPGPAPAVAADHC